MTNIKTAKRLENFEEYIFAKLNKVVAKIEKDSGRKVLNLGQGDPDIKPSQIYIDKCCEFLKEDNAHTYPGYGAQKELSDAFVNWYKKRFDIVLGKDELYPLLGAKDGVSHLPLALLDQGDEVLVPDPGYPGFSSPAKMIGAKVVPYNLTQENNFKINFSELEKKITSKTKFIWVNFPSNPTGQVIEKEELKEIVNFCKNHNLIIIYDNAYADITFDGFTAPSILEIEGAKELAVELGSFSKTFSFAGYRMGWIVGNKKIIAALAKVKSQIDSGLSTYLQKLGAFAFDHFDSAWHAQMIETYKTRRDIIAKHLKSIGCTFHIPKGSLYIWARIPENGKNSEQFCMELLTNKQILLTPGTAFGQNGQRYIRASICANIEKIEDYF